jgi:hypothetical protein
LAHNDHVASLEPLYCSLSSRVCLASQFAYLQSASNEGRTLTQIAQENTFASSEDGEEVLEHEQDKPRYTEGPIELEHIEESIRENDEPVSYIGLKVKSPQESTPNGSSLVGTDSKPEHEDGSPENDGGGPKEKHPDKPNESELPTNEASVTSTVQGDPDDFEGENEISLDLCLKPGICACSTCANISTDNGDLAYHDHDEEGLMEKIAGGAGEPESVVESGPKQSETATRPNQLENLEVESTVQESVSPRTIEAESNQPDEDLFSLDNEYVTDHGRSNSVANHNDLGDSDPEDHNSQGVDWQVDIGNGAWSGPETENYDLNVKDSARGDTGAPDQSYENKPDVTYGEGHEEFLNFEDDEEEEARAEEQVTVAPEYQPVLTENEDARSDSDQNSSKVETTVEAYQSSHNQPDNDLSSKALEAGAHLSSISQSIGNSPPGHAEETPNTPSKSKSGSKRKALEDEDDDFDLFDTATPDKKRRRPSR